MGKVDVWDEQKTILRLAIKASQFQHPGVEGLGMLHIVTPRELGRPGRSHNSNEYGGQVEDEKAK